MLEISQTRSRGHFDSNLVSPPNRVVEIAVGGAVESVSGQSGTGSDVRPQGVGLGLEIVGGESVTTELSVNYVREAICRFKDLSYVLIFSKEAVAAKAQLVKHPGLRPLKRGTTELKRVQFPIMPLEAGKNPSCAIYEAK